MKKFKTLAILLVLVLTSLLVFAACGDEEEPGPVDPVEQTYTYRINTTVSPSNWNVLDYQDNNDTQIMNYLESPFFTYDFKFDSNGDIVDGQFEIMYMAATNLEDVTAELASKYGFKANETGRAYRVTLRDDLKWDNGDAITAQDFIYTMQEQLSPEFLNYRADSFYTGALQLIGAERYAKQGQESNGRVVKKIMEEEGFENVEAFLAAYGEQVTWINWDYSFGAMWNGTEFVAAEDALVKTEYTFTEMYEIFTVHATGGDPAKFDTYHKYFLNEVYEHVSYPECSWDEVAFTTEVDDPTTAVREDLQITFAMNAPLELFKEGTTELSYRAAYNLNNFPLVHEATYESCKVAPAAAGDLWTTTYHTNALTTRSWGPYMLNKFQAGKYYELVRNENWFGYNMPELDGLYQTDKIECETIEEYNTAFLKFRQGGIDSIGIAAAVATDYKGSSRAYYSPSDYVGSLQLQSRVAALKDRESEGINKSILGYEAFRKALSLSIDRDAYNRECTTASLAGYGIYTTVHYYDVANGGAYRLTDPAKRTICEIYGVNVEDYDSLEEAYQAVTGYDLALARELVEAAYQEALAAGDIKATDNIVLTMGSSAASSTVTLRHEWLNDAWKTLMVGTSLEGRFELELNTSFGSKWATDFRAGAYDVCMGGWTGAAWDPGYFLLAYLDPGYMYSQGWDTGSHMMTLTIKGLNDEGLEEEGAEFTYSNNLLGWYACLNSQETAEYKWGSGVISEEIRLQIIAAMEKEVLGVYYTVPIQYEFTAGLRGMKIEYKTLTYNTFMAYGGIKYMTFNYSDAEWAEYLEENLVNGELDYRS